MPGPDIFLSYTRADLDRASLFARGLAEAGLSVWWDRSLRAGESYDRVTEEALRSARAVVVLWSARSAASRWVRAEATLAERNHTLVPAMIEPCERPIMFELTHTADLSHWQGDSDDPAWRSFLADVRGFVGAEPPPVRSASAPLPSLKDVSVAVLPFVNASGDPEQEHFAFGMTEDLITDLSRLGRLRVVSRNSCYGVRDKAADIPAVARQLNVTHIVEGSVRRSGNRLRVTAQLIDGSTNDHVWADRYDRELTDIFDVQDELVAAIAAALKLHLLPGAGASEELRGTRELAAYDLFNRARALRSTMQPALLVEALDLYRQCLAIDQDFAQAWVHYGIALSVARTLLPPALLDPLEELSRAASTAMTLAPGNKQALTLRAIEAQWRYDWDAVAAAAAEAQQLPGWADGLAQPLLGLGRARDALASARAWGQAEPLSLGASVVVQMMLDAVGQSDAAAREYARSKALSGWQTAVDLFAMVRALAAGQAGMARAILQSLVETGQLSAPELYNGIATRLDDPDQLRALLREDFPRPENDLTLRVTWAARFAAFSGDVELALAGLRRGLVERKHGYSVIDLWSPIFASVRQQPEFKQILHDIGLADHWRRSGNWGDFARPVGRHDFEIIR